MVGLEIYPEHASEFPLGSFCTNCSKSRALNMDNISRVLAKVFLVYENLITKLMRVHVWFCCPCIVMLVQMVAWMWVKIVQTIDWSKKIRMTIYFFGQLLFQPKSSFKACVLIRCPIKTKKERKKGNELLNSVSEKWLC